MKLRAIMFGSAVAILAGAGTPAMAVLPAEAIPANLSHASVGKPVYDSDDWKIGTISSVTSTPEFGQAAVVHIGQVLGMPNREVTIPASLLHPRAKGGLFTDLSDEDVSWLPGPNGETSVSMR